MGYLYTSRYYYIPPLCFTAQCGSPVPAQGKQVCLWYLLNNPGLKAHVRRVATTWDSWHNGA